jgi:hypothetical protein
MCRTAKVLYAQMDDELNLVLSYGLQFRVCGRGCKAKLVAGMRKSR